MLLTDLGMGHANAVFKSALFPLLGGASTILLGLWTDRTAQAGNVRMTVGRMLALMLAGLSLCLALCALVAKPGAGNLVSWMIGVSGFLLLGPYSLAAGRLSVDIGGRTNAGTCAGFVDGVGYIGGVIALGFSGWIADRFGWTWVIGGLAAVALGAACVSLKLDAKNIEGKNEPV